MLDLRLRQDLAASVIEKGERLHVRQSGIHHLESFRLQVHAVVEPEECYNFRTYQTVV